MTKFGVEHRVEEWHVLEGQPRPIPKGAEPQHSPIFGVPHTYYSM